MGESDTGSPPSRLATAKARILRWDAALYGLLAVFGLIRLVIVTHSVVFTAYDTFSYAYRDDPAFNRGPLVSLFGHAPRLWGVPLFYRLLPTDTARAVGQWAIGTVAWAVLAIVVWTLFRRPLTKIVGTGAVLVLGLTSSVVSWDFTILAESLSISLGVLTLALFLRWASTGCRASLIGTCAVVVWWTFTRPDIRVFTVFLIVVFAWYAWRRPLRRPASLVAALVLVFTVGWATAVGPAMASTYLRYGSVADEGFMYQLRLQVFGDPAVKAVFQQQLGMPDCPAAAKVADQSAWEIVEFSAAYRSCPDLVAWGEQHKDTAMGEFARAAPGTYLRMNSFLFGQTLAGAHYAQTPTVLPSRISRIAFPADENVEKLLLGAIVVAVAAAVATRSWRWHPVLLPAMIIVAGVSLISAESNVIYGVGEFKRFGVQEAIGLRIAIVVLLAVALDALLLRRAPAGLESEPEPTVQVRENVDGERSTRGGVPSQG